MKGILFVIFAVIAFISTDAQLATGLVSYWKLDESSGTTVTDATGTNSGTVNGPTIGQTGKLGTAYSFDGVNDYVSIPNSTSLNIQSNLITLSAWVKVPTATDCQMIISKICTVGSHVNPYFQYNLQLLRDGSYFFPRFWLTIGGSYSFTANETYNLSLNVWHHIVGTYNGSTMILYVDGVQISSLSKTGNITGYTAPVYLGINGALGEPNNGLIDEVGIWSRALSSTEVSQLYNSGNGLPYSSFGGSVPTAPSGLTATVASCSQINLSWTDNSTTETGFYIYRGGTQIGSVGANVTTYNSTGLSGNTSYSYYVVAYNGTGNSSNSNTASATTSTCTTVPTAPSNLTASVASCNQINLSWLDNSSNETGFYIYRGGSQIASVGSNITSYSNTGLTASTSYNYYVVAYNGAGNSSNSNTASGTTTTCSSGSWTANGSNIYFNTGKVSIGTNIANSASALSVSGKILATEVEVVSSITADYVFEPEYKLMPLTDLEKYLQKHKHLPDFPSATEFSEKGQNLGKTDDLLLRKIEELTLYIIEQNKKIEAIQQQLDKK
jgi:hypothetical protein